MEIYEELRKYNGNIPIETMKFSGNSISEHWHTEIEIMMVISGIFDVKFNSNTYTLSAGDCMIITGGNIHGCIKRDDGDMLMLIFNPGIFSSNDVTLKGFLNPLLIKHNDTAYLEKMYEDIHTETTIQNEASKIIIKSYLGLFSGWIIKNSTEENILPSNQVKTSQLNTVQKLLNYIEENYNKDITLDAAAELLHFSKGYFCKYFKNLTGVTFTKYVNATRNQAAKNLLKTTNLRITDIAERCGYDTVRTFNREFKLQTGITANQYRKG